MRFWRQLAILGITLAAFIILLAPVPAFSQSCALCYTQAASSGSRMIQALKSGILVMIVPPTLGSIGMIFVVYKKRNQVRRTEEEESEEAQTLEAQNDRNDSGRDW
ncbi:MAG: hypothetical protein ABSF93_04060 [Candidatus Sulfotelmatobacter sp.]